MRLKSPSPESLTVDVILPAVMLDTGSPVGSGFWKKNNWGAPFAGE